jgi:hypothetical protein
LVRDSGLTCVIVRETFAQKLSLFACRHGRHARDPACKAHSENFLIDHRPHPFKRVFVPSLGTTHKRKFFLGFTKHTSWPFFLPPFFEFPSLLLPTFRPPSLTRRQQVRLHFPSSLRVFRCFRVFLRKSAWKNV